MDEKRDLPPQPDLAGVSDEHFEISASYIAAVIEQIGYFNIMPAAEWSNDWPDPCELVIEAKMWDERPDAEYFIGAMEVPVKSFSEVLQNWLETAYYGSNKEQTFYEKVLFDALMHSFEKAKVAARIARAQKASKP